ncbi:MAG TPA: Ig-like domain-containing protein [Gemmatimonadales bacterium]|nr:Ig-like domain-containing protein [Gemmatimonadales bacterium]
MRRIALCLLALALPNRLSAQGSEPLRKTDLTRLLSSVLIAKGEIADLIRRNCLAFRPTERDWADLRDLGADVAVMSAVGSCTARAAPSRPGTTTGRLGVPPPPLAPATLEAVPLASAVAVPAGTEAVLRVQARRGETPERGVRLVLRGGSGTPGGLARSIEAVTGDSGLAVFRTSAGHQAQTYRLEVLTGGGAVLPGRPMISLAVVAAAPAGADIQPSRLDLGREEGPVAVQVAVRDSFGNPVTHEPVELKPQSADLGLAPDTRSTDSLGRATFTIPSAAVRRPGRIAVRVRGQLLGSIEAFLTSAISRARSGFTAGRGQRGIAGWGLPEPLVFQARAPSGRPLPGRVVVFQARNAQIVPDSAVTDSTGQARLEVTLGSGAGSAVVTATVESVQWPESLQVLSAAPAELVLERDGVRVDHERIVVEFGTPFALALKVRDEYGNLVPAAALSHALQSVAGEFNTRWQLVKLLGIQSDSLTTMFRFQPLALGITDLTLNLGLKTSVSIEVVRSGR